MNRHHSSFEELSQQTKQAEQSVCRADDDELVAATC